MFTWLTNAGLLWLVSALQLVLVPGDRGHRRLAHREVVGAGESGLSHGSADATGSGSTPEALTEVQ